MVPYCYLFLLSVFILLFSYYFIDIFVNFRQLNDHLFRKELFIRFSASAFRKLPSIYVFSYFPFGFEGRIWDLIVSVPDHCLSFYLYVSTLHFFLFCRFPQMYTSSAIYIVNDSQETRET